MLSKIGNMLGRKPAAQPAPAARAPFPTTSSSPMRRPAANKDSRTNYARIFRWGPPAENTGLPVSVEIVGSFTRWVPVPLKHNTVDNTWAVTVDSIPGNKTHHYVLLLDGKPTYDPFCDGYAMPVGFDEEQFALQTPKGARVLMLFANAK